MRVLQITGFLLVILALATQTVRHICVYYVAKQPSVLEKYEKTDTRRVVREAASLEELLALYDPAGKHEDELNAMLKEAKAAAKTMDERNFVEEKFREAHQEEYSRARQLRAAIEDWEHKNEQVFELHFFWAFGIGLFVLGAVLVARGWTWLGMSFIIPGVVEMLWWTSPSISFSGCPVEFDRLLWNKIALSLVTLTVIIVAWVLNERKNRTKQAAAT